MKLLSELLTFEDLVSLVTAGHSLAATIDNQALLNTILESAGRLTNSPDASIILHDKRRDSLYFAHALGSKAAFLLEEFGEHATKQIPWESKAGEVFRSGRVEVKLELDDDPKHFKGVDEVTSKKTESMITIPLMAGQECIGVMQVLNKPNGEYTHRDQVLLEEFAGYAGVALRNARLIEDLLAHMGLYSKRRKKRNAAEVIKLLSAPPQSERMTIMFVDLRGFRGLCQRISTPQKLTRMLNAFLSLLVDRVLFHDGVVNKYLGDGILAFFSDHEHEIKAVNCAFDIVDAFGPLKASWIGDTPADIGFVDIGIGICTDEAIIGPMGSDEIKDFTVIGTVVNLAAAFEFEARGGRQVLVDQPTFSKVSHLYDADAPIPYELRHPGQPTAHSYPQFHLRRKAPVPSRQLSCFVSFSHDDQSFVEEYVLKELDRQGIKVWFAPRSIDAGEQWPKAITDGLEKSDFVIVIVSENSAKSKWVPREINVAMTIPYLADRIIPVRIDQCRPEKVHRYLASLERVEYKDLPRLEQYVKKFTPVLAPARETESG